MKKFPLLFVGHGSPINAIEENEFVEGFRKISEGFPKPKTILCISAHWVTSGIRITSIETPRTIHDFYGFPEELYKIEYKALGNPSLAKRIQTQLGKELLELDFNWGLDHGTWTVLKHMYPKADVEVLQLSLDSKKTILEHYEFAKKLSFLREEVLIVGSGNIVHNLSLLDWKNIYRKNYFFEWAEQANQKMKTWILERSHSKLINILKWGKEFQLAIPTLEHYLPLIYIIAMQEENETASFFNDMGVGGSLSMTSVLISSNEVKKF